MPSNQTPTPLPHVYPLENDLPREEALDLTHEIIARCNYYFAQYLEESLEGNNYEVNIEKTYDHKCKDLVIQLKISLQLHSNTTDSHDFQLVFNNKDLNESVEVSLFKKGNLCPSYNDQLILEECSLVKIRRCVETLVSGVYKMQ